MSDQTKLTIEDVEKFLEDYEPTIEDVEKILNIKLIKDPELFTDIKKYSPKKLFNINLNEDKSKREES